MTTDEPGLTASMNHVPPMVLRRNKATNAPSIVPATHRRIVLRARIAVEYPTTLDPSDLPHWFAGALVTDAERLGANVDLCQIALAADPAWRGAGPADLTDDVDRQPEAGT